MTDWRAAIDGCLRDLAGELSAIRRHLHAHPEPSREEFATARFLAGRLKAAGIPLRLVAGGRGIIAGPGGDGPAPAVAMRGDIDALRIAEENDVAYRSTRPGVMHACGHDAHATMVLGAALALHARRAALPGPVPWRAILQPGEEVGEGAREMVAEGAADDLAAIVGLHVDPERPVGEVGHRVGPLTAHTAELDVLVHGSGGHGARPHAAIDPLAAAAQFVVAAYAQVPRSGDAREAVVLSFGAIQGGDAANAIPERVVLRGTIRTLGRASADRVENRLRAVAAGVEAMTGVRITVTFKPGTDAVVNDPGVTAVMVRAAGEVVGPGGLRPIPLPSMGGEDFSAYLAKAPGAMLRLGVAAPERPRQPLHSPRFDLDERALVIGARLLARTLVLLHAPDPS